MGSTIPALSGVGGTTGASFLYCIPVPRQGHFWEQVAHASHVKALGGQLERLLLCLRAVSVVSVTHRCVCSSLHSRRAGRSLPAPGTQLQLLAFPMELKLALPTTALNNVLCSSTLNHYFLFASSHSHPCQSKAPQLQFLFISHWSLCRTSAVP